MSGERPAVDLQIYFDFNSAAISPKAVPQLTNLGNALTQPELRDLLITLNGHTDAKGTDLQSTASERRAETIKRVLVDHFQLSAQNLVTVGFGKQGPKQPDDLFARRTGGSRSSTAPQTQAQR
jgi:outer membrane protein OmpA-like peptidoglycan-associated protein